MRVYVLLLATIALVSCGSGMTVVVNSADWRDVFSGMHYAALTGSKGVYFRDASDSESVLLKIPEGETDVLYLVSGDTPFVSGFEERLKSEELDVETLIGSKSNPFWLQLGRRYNPDSVILVSANVGSSAISVSTYAQYLGAYVVPTYDGAFVEEFLSERSLSSLMLYGEIPRRIRDFVGGIATEVVDNGDSYLDNLEIAERFINLTGADQVLLTDGSFIESSFFNPERDLSMPVVFIDEKNTPKVVEHFLIASGVVVGELIGNHLAEEGRELGNRVGFFKSFSVFLKVGQSRLTSKGRFSKLIALDYFPIPSEAYKVYVGGVNYDFGGRKLMVSMRNPTRARLYFQNTIIVFVRGERARVVGDKVPMPLAGGASDTVTYSIESDSLSEGDLEVHILSRYGKGRISMTEYIEREVGDVPFSSFVSPSNVLIEYVAYDGKRGGYSIRLRNVGPAPVYASVGLRFTGERTKEVYSDRVLLIPAGEVQEYVIPYSAPESGMRSGVATAKVRFGFQRDALVKEVSEGVLIRNPPINFFIPPRVLLVLFVLFAVLVMRWRF